MQSSMVINRAYTEPGMGPMTAYAWVLTLVMRDRAETEAQVKGFSGANCQGFSNNAGGLEAARKAFDTHVVEIALVQRKDERPTKKRCQRQPSIISISSTSETSNTSSDVDARSCSSVKVEELSKESQSACINNHQVATTIGDIKSRDVDIVDLEAKESSDYGSVDDQDLVLTESQSSNTGNVPPSTTSPIL